MHKDRIGIDEWVASYESRLARGTGIREGVRRLVALLPEWLWLMLGLAAVLAVPMLSVNDYLLRVLGGIALTIMLGTGLTLVTGYAGLLDLGYIAFYGLGAYGYAYLSSDFTGIHLPIFVSLPLIVLSCSLIGGLLGMVSLRLSGDYLAIATLGFGLIFVQFLLTFNRIWLPGLERPIDLTGGPNGIVRLDGLNIGIVQLDHLHVMYLVLVLAAVLLLTILHRLNRSPVGRSWRALREDDLAAETMGIPTQRLKLLAFALGAGVAGFAGAFFALWQGAVFPSSFDLAALIALYSVIVLGGLGSLRGVVIGAMLMVALPEVLRQPALATLLFYSAGATLAFALLKPRWLAILPLAGMGITAWIIVALPLSDMLLTVGNFAFAGLIIVALGMMRTHSVRLRLGLLVLLLPLSVVAWHVRLLPEPGITRFILLGALLIGMMVHRPDGLFGQKRVEVL
ncbi:MAG: branched-chain amino acid ABC transporter permease [Anaerolineae bacterium]|nr:branched-chain amino acid ABC transporter permease [Anaerolineae bacterium]